MLPCHGKCRAEFRNNAPVYECCIIVHCQLTLPLFKAWLRRLSYRLTADSRRGRDPWSRSELWTCCTATDLDETSSPIDPFLLLSLLSSRYLSQFMRKSPSQSTTNAAVSLQAGSPAMQPFECCSKKIFMRLEYEGKVRLVNSLYAPSLKHLPQMVLILPWWS